MHSFHNSYKILICFGLITGSKIYTSTNPDVTGKLSAHLESANKTSQSQLPVPALAALAQAQSSNNQQHELKDVLRSFDSQHERKSLRTIAQHAQISSYVSNQSSPHKEVYISVDIEADGPTPLDGNMISLAAVCTDLDLNVLGIFEVNLKPHMKPNPVTMQEFWSKHPEAYNRTKVNAVDPKEGMLEFVNWMAQFSNGGKHSISMMALPTGYDKMFIQPYSVVFGNKSGGSLDGVGGIDIEQDFNQLFETR